MAGTGGAWLTGYSAWLMWRGMKAAAWPTVFGEVTQSEVVNEGSSFDPRFTHQLTYRYEVRGRKYEGHQAWLAREYSEWKAAPIERQAHKYPVKTRVKVHYHREDPAQAVLEVGLDGRAILIFAAGAGFLAWSIVRVVEP